MQTQQYQYFSLLKKQQQSLWPRTAGLRKGGRMCMEGAASLFVLLKGENLHFFPCNVSPFLFNWCCKSSPSCFRFCMSIEKKTQPITKPNHRKKSTKLFYNRRTLLHSAASFQRAATFGIKMEISGIAGTQSFLCCSQNQ